MAAPGWYTDPSDAGRKRYFDGVQWTNSYYYGSGAMSPQNPAAPADVLLTPPPAGWYPDPDARSRRRYWDGSTWTNNYTSAGLRYPMTKKSTAITATAFAFLFACGLSANAETNALGHIAVIVFGFLLLAVIFAGPVWLAYYVDERRKERQAREDRNAELAIHAEVEHDAYLKGDTNRGVHGQFPPGA